MRCMSDLSSENMSAYSRVGILPLTSPFISWGRKDIIYLVLPVSSPIFSCVYINRFGVGRIDYVVEGECYPLSL